MFDIRGTGVAVICVNLEHSSPAPAMRASWSLRADDSLSLRASASSAEWAANTASRATRMERKISASIWGQITQVHQAADQSVRFQQQAIYIWELCLVPRAHYGSSEADTVSCSHWAGSHPLLHFNAPLAGAAGLWLLFRTML
jgi:hypothetical protein